MKIFLCLLATLAIVSCESESSIQYLENTNDVEVEPLQERKAITANINDVLDSVLDDIGIFLTEQGLDPLTMPDIKEGFKAKPAFITYHGELELTEGVMHDLAAVSRKGDALLQYEKKLLRVSMGLKFDFLKLQYNYLAKIMNIGPKGKVLANVKGTEIFFDIILDLEDFTLYLQNFNIPAISNIKVHFKGNFLTDWLVNPLVRVTTSIFKSAIRNVMENEINKLIKNLINDFNTKRFGPAMVKFR